MDGWVAQGKQNGVQGQALHCQIVKISDLRLATCILILSSPSSAVDSGTRPAIAFRPSPWSFTVPESLKIELHRYSLCLKGLGEEVWEMVQVQVSKIGTDGVIGQ